MRIDVDTYVTPFGDIAIDTEISGAISECYVDGHRSRIRECKGCLFRISIDAAAEVAFALGHRLARVTRGRGLVFEVLPPPPPWKPEPWQQGFPGPLEIAPTCGCSRDCTCGCKEGRCGAHLSFGPAISAIDASCRYADCKEAAFEVFGWHCMKHAKARAGL